MAMLAQEEMGKKRTNGWAPRTCTEERNIDAQIRIRVPEMVQTLPLIDVSKTIGPGDETWGSGATT